MKPADDVRETPPAFFEALNAKHNFTIDACALASNAKCPVYYSPFGLCQLTEGGMWKSLREVVGGGLAGRFDHQRVYCNPPFSAFEEWLPWAWRNSAAESITMIAPATRTDRPWWAQWVEPYRDDQPERRIDNTAPFIEGTAGWRLKTDFHPGRIDFLEDGHPIYRKNNKGEVLLKTTGKKNLGQPIASSCMFGIVSMTWSHV